MPRERTAFVRLQTPKQPIVAWFPARTQDLNCRRQISEAFLYTTRHEPFFGLLSNHVGSNGNTPPICRNYPTTVQTARLPRADRRLKRPPRSKMLAF